MNKKVESKHFRKHVDKKVQWRLRIYIVLSVIMIGIVGYDILQGLLNIWLSLVGFSIGIIVGGITARMMHISWNKDMQKVITRLDFTGAIVILLYVGFSYLRNQVIGYFVHGPAVAALSFSVIAGVMLGRVFGTRGKIIKILQEQEIFG